MQLWKRQNKRTLHHIKWQYTWSCCTRVNKIMCARWGEDKISHFVYVMQSFIAFLHGRMPPCVFKASQRLSSITASEFTINYNVPVLSRYTENINISKCRVVYHTQVFSNNTTNHRWWKDSFITIMWSMLHDLCPPPPTRVRVSLLQSGPTLICMILNSVINHFSQQNQPIFSLVRFIPRNFRKLDC